MADLQFWSYYAGPFTYTMLMQSVPTEQHQLLCTTRNLPRSLTSLLTVFFPAALAASRVFCQQPKQWPHRGTVLAAMLLQPALLLIDHAHFQYNCISLGLVAGAAAAVASGRHIVGSVLYCLALNHKQMSLYFAPAFFGYLLGRCLEHKTALQKASYVCLWLLLLLKA